MNKLIDNECMGRKWREDVWNVKIITINNDGNDDYIVMSIFNNIDVSDSMIMIMVFSDDDDGV